MTDHVRSQPGGTRVLVLAYDRIGTRMAGPGVRSWELAKAMAGAARVTVASTEPIERAADGIDTVQFTSEEQLAKLVASADVVLVQGLALRRHRCLQRCNAVLVVDLYDPWVLENMEMHAAMSDASASQLLYADAGVQNELVDHGDFFICASERQRDYWMGMLTSRLRLDRAAWRDDAELRTLVDVVPYGAPQTPPSPGPALRGVHPKVTSDDTVFLWSGGTWEWFDPMIVLEAFASALRSRRDMVLYFMGLGIKGRTPDMPVAKRLEARATELGLLGDRVIFGDWVPYDERAAHLLEADAAVLATRPSAEARLAFRSRMLDHFWTGLPTLTTPGDTLAELIESCGAGSVVPFNDVRAWERELLSVASNPERTAAMSEAAGRLAARFAWRDAARPLMRVVHDPNRWFLQREQRYRLREACDLPRIGMPDAGRLQPTGFHSRGRVLNRLKRSRAYPFMRTVRRSRAGRIVWGEVPGE